jgi:cytochrome d ubiquinol oxidase subunit II
MEALFTTTLGLSRLQFAVTTIVPMLLSAVCVGMAYVSIVQRREKSPFAWTAGFVVFAFVALGASYYPYLLPPNLTAAEAAAQPLTMRVMLVGLLIFLPILIGYNIYMYWVFRGKVTTNVYEEH